MPYYPNTHSAKQKSPALSRAFEIVARPRGTIYLFRIKRLNLEQCKMPHHKSYDTPTIRTNLAKYSQIFILLQETMLIGDLWHKNATINFGL